VNVRDKFGRTALHYAALYGQNTLVEPLLKKGFDPNALDTETRMTPTLIACESGKIQVVEGMLKYVRNWGLV
jgi:ankyrin repeat protein